MKIKIKIKIKIKEILWRIWLISANKIKPSEYICKQSGQTQTQVIIVTNNCHTSLPVNARKCPLLESTKIALCRKSPSCNAIRIIQMSRTPVRRDMQQQQVSEPEPVHIFRLRFFKDVSMISFLNLWTTN